MPQFDPASFASQLFWLAVCFAVVYWFVVRFAVPQIGGIIEQRRSTIADDFGMAEQLRAEAERVREAYETALRSARSDAASAVETVRAEAAADRAREEEAFARRSEAELAAAESRITETITQARGELAAVCEDLCGDIVERLVGSRPDADDVRPAVAERIGRA